MLTYPQFLFISSLQVAEVMRDTRGKRGRHNPDHAERYCDVSLPAHPFLILKMGKLAGLEGITLPL